MNSTPVLFHADLYSLTRHALTFAFCQAEGINVIQYCSRLFIYYTRETLLNHIFEDLWKTKAPQQIRSKLREKL